MAKWVAAFVGLVVVLGIMMYRLGKDSDEIQVEVPPEAISPKVSAELPTKKRVEPIKRASKAATPKSDTPAVAKLDPTSDEFSHELDVGIPDGFKAKMAACERDGAYPNAKITISYKLHIENDVVSASNVRIKGSNLGDTSLEQCMVAAVQDGRWVASEMPDFSEEQDLFVRMRSLDKYLDAKEQVEAKERRKVEE